MNMNEVRDRAKAAGIAAGKARKAELVRMIQHAEGNPGCFGAGWRFDCPQLDCCWRKDCLTKNPG